MDNKEILELAQSEKKDEGKQAHNDFALGGTGAFALIMMSILLILRIVRNENAADMLSLLSGTVAAYSYSKFTRTNSKLWFLLFILLIMLCLFFFEKYW